MGHNLKSRVYGQDGPQTMPRSPRVPDSDSSNSSVGELNLRYLDVAQQAALKTANSLLLVNGGAIVASLSLLSVLAANKVPPQVAAQALKAPLLLFVVGICAAIFALICVHYSAHKAAWGEPRWERNFRWMLRGSIITSLTLFAAGSWYALQAVSSIQPLP